MNSAIYVDSHAHLDLPEFDADRAAVIARSQEAGVRHLLLIADATKPESLQKVAGLAESNQGIYWAAGIDPHEAASARDEHFEALARIASHPKFLAVGEIGLDYYYDYPRDLQHQVFIRQLDLALELHRPVIIHCRDAWSDLREIVRRQLQGAWTGPHVQGAGVGRRAGILHCFTGTTDDALDLVDLGFYASFAGNLTYKKADGLRAVAAAVPVERLLSETDCPYLAPTPHRGHRNEPALVVETTRELARVRGLAQEEMGAQLVRNFAELFQLQMNLDAT